MGKVPLHRIQWIIFFLWETELKGEESEHIWNSPIFCHLGTGANNCRFTITTVVKNLSNVSMENAFFITSGGVEVKDLASDRFLPAGLKYVATEARSKISVLLGVGVYRIGYHHQNTKFHVTREMDA